MLLCILHPLPTISIVSFTVFTLTGHSNIRSQQLTPVRKLEIENLLALYRLRVAGLVRVLDIPLHGY